MMTDQEIVNNKICDKISFDLSNVRFVGANISSIKTRCMICDKPIPAKTIHLTHFYSSYKGNISYRGVHYKCYIKRREKEIKIINKYKNIKNTMPNWCENTLTINGKEKDIKEFKNKVKNKFTFSKFISMPKELNELDKLEAEKSPSDSMLARIKEIKSKFNINTGPGWYIWNINNFGCKWDVKDAILVLNAKNELKYQFDTPWSPPETAIINISRQYPKLTFTLNYSEPGMGFAGILRTKRGKIIHKEEYNMF